MNIPESLTGIVRDVKKLQTNSFAVTFDDGKLVKTTLAQAIEILKFLKLNDDEIQKFVVSGQRTTEFANALSSNTIPISIQVKRNGANYSTPPETHPKIAAGTLFAKTAEKQKKNEAKTDWPADEEEPDFVPVPVPIDNYDAVRIGYATFTAPIKHVAHNIQSYIHQEEVIREPGTIKSGTGYAQHNYTINYLCTNTLDIERGVRDVFDQILINPFISCSGGPFGDNIGTGDIPHHEFSVQSMSLSTVPGMPGALSVELNLDPFMFSYWCPQAENKHTQFGYQLEMDDVICWPLVKLWAKTRQSSIFTNFKQQGFAGTFSLSFPSEKVSKQIVDVSTERDSKLSDDYFTFKALNEAIDRQGFEPDKKVLTSPFLKQIKSPDIRSDERVYLIKVNSRQTFELMLGQPGFIGLADWSKFKSHNFIDDNGNYLPESNQIDVTRIASSVNSVRGFTDYNFVNDAALLGEFQSGELKFLAVPATKNRDTLYANVIKYIDAIAGDRKKTNNPLNAAKKAEILANIQDNFAVAIKVNLNNETKLQGLVNKVLNREKKNVKSFSQQTKDRFIELLEGDTDSYTPVMKSGFVDNDDIIVEHIGGRRSNNLVPLQVNGITIPVHQYLGGGSSEFIVKGECFTLEAKKRIEKVKNDFDKRCLNTLNSEYAGDLQTNANVTPFLFVNNEIFALMGVDFVMPLSVSFETVDGKPNVWSFEIVLLEYNPVAQAAERIKFLATTLQDQQRLLDFQNPQNGAPDPLVEKAVEYFSLQYSLSKLNPYPDMKLPSRGERDFWIYTLRKEAKYRKANKKPSQNLDETETSIIETCEDFLHDPYCLNQIAKFKNPYAENKVRQSITDSSFVDPDFYICYDFDTGFGAVVDKLATQEFGPRVNGYDADSSKVNKKNIYREYDPKFNTHTIFAAHTSGADAKDSEKNLKSALENTFPPENKKEAVDVCKEAAETLTQHPSAWWKGTDGKLAGETFIDNNPEYFNGSNNNAILPVVSTEDSSGQEALTYTNGFGKDFYDLISFKWRHNFVQTVAKSNFNGKKGGYLTRDQLKTNTFLLPFIPINFDSFAGKEEGFFRDLTKLGGDSGIFRDVTTFDKLKLLPEDAVGYLEYKTAVSGDAVEARTLKDLTNYSLSLKLNPLIENNSNIMVVTGDNLNLEKNKFSFVHRTALQSHNYNAAKLIKEVSHDVIESTNETDAMLETAKTFDIIATRYDVDPNMLRAFALRQSGFNVYKSNTSDALGFLKLSSEVTTATSDPETQIDLLAKTYSKYLKRYNNTPSLAITATYMELTKDGRETGWDGKGNINKLINDQFTSASVTLASNKYGKGAANAITQALSTSNLKNRVDQIWTAYIEVSRVLGSSLSHPSQVDLFFDPFNPFIIMDARTNKTYVDTRITPSGEIIRIDLARDTVYALSADARSRGITFDNSLFGIEGQADLALRNQFGLDPTNEAAVYGSMVDARRYCQYGRLLQAFPTYQVLIINEGFFFANGSVRMWDQFYSRGGVTNIAVHKSAIEPIHKAEVTFSNLFYSLTRYTQMDALRQELTVKQSLKFQTSLGLDFSSFFQRMIQNLITKTPDKEFLQLWQYNHLQQLALAPGARLQIRMGAGSNAAKLPIVFNGNITEVPVNQGTVTIIAQGDGAELYKPITDNVQSTDNGYLYQTGKGIGGIGYEPAAILGEAFVPNSMFIAATTQGKYGVNRMAPHFGDIYFDGNNYHTPEVYMNMYGASKKTVEQTFDFVGSAFNKNGLYNWDDTSLISISIKEPTIWKTAQVCRNAVMDFTVGVETFHTRSTMFFGRWWYPFNYAYDPSILKFNGAGQITSVTLNKAENLPTAKAEVAKPLPVSPKYDAKPAKDNTLEQLKEFARNKATGVNSLHQKIKQRLEVIKFTEQILFVFNIIPQVGTNYGLDVWVTQVGTQLKFYQVESSTIVPIEFVNAPPENVALLKMTPITPKQASELLKFELRDNSNRITPDPRADVAIKDKIDEITNFGVLTDASTADATMLREVRNYVTYLKWKPYTQCWPVSSALNLIDTNIIPRADTVFTDAKGQNTYNGVASGDTISKTLAFSVDDDIAPGQRKTLLCDTGLLVTSMQKGFSRAIGDAVASWTPVVGESIKETPDTQAVENSVVNMLTNTVKTMYQGSFTMTGLAAIKPNDLILFNDTFNCLEGPLFVREVVHMMGHNTGFVTVVTPSCVALPAFSILGPKYMVAMATGPLSTVGQYFVGRTATALTGAYLKGFLTKGYKVKINELRDLTSYIGQLGDANLSSLSVYQQAYPELSTSIVKEIDQELLKVNLSTERRELLQKLKQDLLSSKMSLNDVTVRLARAGIKLPEVGSLGTKAFPEITKILTEIEAFQALTLRELMESKDPVIRALSLREKQILADKRALDLLNAKIKELFALNKAPEITKTIARIEELDKLILNANKLLADEISSGSFINFQTGKTSVLLRSLNKEREELTSFLKIAKTDDLLSYLNEVIKTLEEVSKLPPELRSIFTGINAAGDVEKAWKTASAFVKITTKVKQAEALMAAAKDSRGPMKLLAKAVTGTVSIVSLVSPIALLKVSFEVVKLTIGNSWIEWVNANMRARQCVKIYPLRTTGTDGMTIPLVAGIRGHQGAVVGDKPSFFDSAIDNLLGGKSDNIGAKGLFFLGALVGLEVPDYGNTDLESEYLQKIKKTYKVGNVE